MESPSAFEDVEQRERGSHGSTSCAYKVMWGNDGPSLLSALPVRAVAGNPSYCLNTIVFIICITGM